MKQGNGPRGARTRKLKRNAHTLGIFVSGTHPHTPYPFMASTVDYVYETLSRGRIVRVFYYLTVHKPCILPANRGRNQIHAMGHYCLYAFLCSF